MVEIPRGIYEISVGGCDGKNGERCRGCGGKHLTKNALVIRVYKGDISNLCGPQYDEASRALEKLKQFVSENNLWPFCWQMVILAFQERQYKVSQNWETFRPR